MFNTGNCSVPLVAPINGGNNDGFGGDGGWAWWIIILLIFGWGGNGFGGFGNNGNGYTDSALQRGFDQQSVISKLDGITQGVCDSTYALNSSMQNGFSGVNQSLCQGFNGVNTTMLQGFNGVERGFCNMSAQLADCCCQNREAISQVRYDMATQACDTRQAIQTSTRDILENNNANTRAILDFMTQDKIATLQAENQSLKLAASQANQNAVLTAAMDANKAEIIRRTGNDCPIPAYVVPNPNCCYGTPVGVMNNGCGCA